MSNNLIIKFPVALCAHDYHDFDGVAVTIQEATRTKGPLKYYELGYTTAHKYVAIFYLGRKPSKDTMRMLLKEANLELMDGDLK